MPVIAPDKVLFLTEKYCYFILFLLPNTHYGYSLEVPRWDTSNEYAVFSSYRTLYFFQYYQLTVNENSDSDYFT